MSNLEKAAQVVYESCYGRNLHPGQVSSIVRGLDDAGLLAPDAQVIRTQEELEELDPDTCTLDKYGDFDFAKAWLDENGRMFEGHADFLPAVAFVTGAQVRAAREAMEQGNE